MGAQDLKWSGSDMVSGKAFLLFCYTGGEGSVLCKAWNVCEKAVCAVHGDVVGCENFKCKR